MNLLVQFSKCFPSTDTNERIHSFIPLIVFDVIKSALKCKWKQHWSLPSNVLFPTNSFSREEICVCVCVLRGCYPSLHRFRSPTPFSFSFSDCVLFVEGARTHSKNSLSSANVRSAREEKRKRKENESIFPSLLVSPLRFSRSLRHSLSLEVWSRWNASNITRVRFNIRLRNYLFRATVIIER